MSLLLLFCCAEELSPTRGRRTLNIISAIMLSVNGLAWKNALVASDRSQHPEPTTDALIHAWLSTLVSASTTSAYRSDLRIYVRWVESTGRGLMSVSVDDVHAFRSHSETQGVAPATVRRRLAAISSFYRHVANMPGAVDPTVGARRPSAAGGSRTVELSPVEADAVWHAAARIGQKTAIVVGLILLHGMRSSELLALDVGDLNNRGGTLTVDRRPLSARTLVVDPRLADILRRHVLRRHEGPLLLGDNPTREPARLTRFGVDYLVKRSGVSAGLDQPLTVNTLRRTYARNARTAGASDDGIRHDLGHADIRTTRRYLDDVIEHHPPGSADGIEHPPEQFRR
jgi:integrase/recombinase XerD